MFKKILIANRGEIALRILRACKDMGIETVAIHSTADAKAMHVRLADESVCIGPHPSRESYLNMHSIISAATITNSDAIHPGFGFLSENSDFAHMVCDHGFAFIGPSPEHIEIMGDKITAKDTAKKLSIPTIPGSTTSVSSTEEAIAVANEIGYPVIIKATLGGGGKGMKVVKLESEMESLLSLARSEAISNFGCGDVYIEKYLSGPRHIEIQVLCDKYGNAIHLGERDCSIQRRHQKIFEEALSPVITKEQRDYLGKIVTDAMKGLGYVGVGTVEFLYENNEFYFIEMNTRIQVEHPVTEMVTGVDLIKEQIKASFGVKLRYKQEDIVFKGHAIECRINAENPDTFTPSPGKITACHQPAGPYVRVDSAIYAGYDVPPYYDSLIAKLIVWGETRQECLMHLRRAINEYSIEGIDTNIALHRRLLSNKNIIDGDYDIHWLEKYLIERNT
jgi:acetyl-CoA carboxylase, biotin carboxylase subunit